jgi:hypothetical protein
VPTGDVKSVAQKLLLLFYVSDALDYEVKHYLCLSVAPHVYYVPVQHDSHLRVQVHIHQPTFQHTSALLIKNVVVYPELSKLSVGMLFFY